MIEPVSASNLPDVLPLIKAYQQFYKAPPTSSEHNLQFFSQFGEHSEQGCQFLYRDNNKVLAFATVYFTVSSTIAEKIAVLNDLYVSEGSRDQGIAKQLIKHCLQFSKARGAARLQWVTARDNLAANALYDSVEAKKSEWSFYSLS